MYLGCNSVHLGCNLTCPGCSPIVQARRTQLDDAAVPRGECATARLLAVTDGGYTLHMKRVTDASRHTQTMNQFRVPSAPDRT